MIVANVIEVPVERLQVGMYVSGLDRPWLETPFLMQGFYVRQPEDVQVIGRYCQYVYVDIEKGRGSFDYAAIKRTVSSQRPRSLKKETSESAILGLSRSPERQKALEQMFPHRTLRHYEDKATTHQELTTARKVYQDLSYCMRDLVDDFRLGGGVDIEAVRQAVDPMIDSIIRNPDACMWLARLKSRDSYTYKHSIGASVWAVALGRQIGLPTIDLKMLAVGAMLCDVGKLQLPSDLLTKQGRLSKGEFTLVRSHVELGVQAILEAGNPSQQVIDIVAHHHERHNGRGYPKKLAGTEIPVLARIAAIADCYDAMTSQRVYAAAVSPSLAVRKLYEWRDVDFQAELIEEFIQAIGLYPSGTLVELSNGEVGIVLAESRIRRLRPHVLVLLDKNKKTLQRVRHIKLQEVTEDEETGEPLEIVRSLSPGSFGIDPESIYY
jgi:putative nucleotidyltransferase with HDIG domain